MRQHVDDLLGRHDGAPEHPHRLVIHIFAGYFRPVPVFGSFGDVLQHGWLPIVFENVNMMEQLRVDDRFR